MCESSATIIKYIYKEWGKSILLFPKNKVFKPFGLMPQCTQFFNCSRLTQSAVFNKKCILVLCRNSAGNLFI
jgi:hypothetical protein